MLFTVKNAPKRLDATSVPTVWGGTRHGFTSVPTVGGVTRHGFIHRSCFCVCNRCINFSCSFFPLRKHDALSTWKWCAIHLLFHPRRKGDKIYVMQRQSWRRGYMANDSLRCEGGSTCADFPLARKRDCFPSERGRRGLPEAASSIPATHCLRNECPCCNPV